MSETAVTSNTDVTLERILKVVERAKQYFPNNPYMRAGLYCHAATVEGRDNPLLSPRIITPLIVGRAGYGKTSILRQLARDMGIGYREIKLGGITDIAELFGRAENMLDPKTGRPLTVLALPEWWPNPEVNPEDAEGFIVFDDCTRCLPHVFQAVMQFMIDGGFNELCLPEGWSCMATSNPSNGEYNVIELDPAQSSRMLVMGYNRPPELFYEQCEKQGVHDDMKSFWASHPELLDVAPVDVPKPDDNDRTKMIWNRVYPYLKYDDNALMLVGTTMFGSQFVVTLKASLASDQPIDPISILYNWDTVSDKFAKYVQARRTDLIAATTVRLIAWIDTRDVTELDDEAFSNLAHFGVSLPQSDSHNLIQRLCQDGERGNLLAARMKVKRTREDGTTYFEDHVMEFSKKMRDMILSTRRNLGIA